jgi:hypothetical protein
MFRGAHRAYSVLLVALFLLACAMPFSSARAQASTGTDSETADARAVIVTRNSFFLVQDLSFGDFLAGNTTQSLVRLLPNGTRIRDSGNVVLLNNNHQPARFAGQGRRNQVVLISMEATPIFLTGPGAAMRVDRFEIGSTPTAILTTTPASFTITSASGAYNFPVGARLRINANQAPGTYTGQFTINLDYQ